MGYVPPGPNRCQPPPIHHRGHTVECFGCGAAVHPTESRCTYCACVPKHSSEIEEERAHEIVEVTCLADENRRFVVQTLAP